MVAYSIPCTCICTSLEYCPNIASKYRSFKLPKVVLKQKKDLELPSFAWESIAKKKKLGSGSFGLVYLATHGSSTSQHVVVKKLKSVSIDSQTLFLKEARILNSAKGHRNVSSFLGFCSQPYSLMMQYCGYFGVERIVGSLADFLQFVDTEFEFSSFSDLLPVCVNCQRHTHRAQQQYSSSRSKTE